MNLGTRPFIIFQNPENSNQEYLGSDGVPISESYELYLEKCAEFKAKAKKYARDNEYLKKAIVHYEKLGFENLDEEEILSEREQQMAAYEKAFDFKVFDEDPNAKYECFTGKGKRIRIIRELDEEERVAEFSEEFDEKSSCWFTRYCLLSRFIQVARFIIIQNRLKKNLEILKSLTPEKVYKIERMMARERGELVESIVEEPEKTESKERNNYPCSCNALKEKESKLEGQDHPCRNNNFNK